MSIEYLGNMEYDITNTIKDYDYTNNAVFQFNNIVHSKEFEEMDSETIYSYLTKTMEEVSFNRYLKRYVYDKAGIEEPFNSVSDKEYFAIIDAAFKENNAPHSFVRTSTTRRAMIKNCLTQKSVKRSVVFVLGFGLRMDDSDVSDFLTKVCKETDFNFLNPQETIYWYCYHHNLYYRDALSYLRYYEESEDQSEFDERFFGKIEGSLKNYLNNERVFKAYLLYLRAHSEKQSEISFQEFMKLYQRSIEALKVYYKRNYFEEGGEDRVIREADIENVLCSSAPMKNATNLIPVTRSSLSRQFDKKRMSRQRISGLLKKKIEIDRFDLLTLLFLVYAITEESEYANDRYIRFIDEANEILQRCHMMGIYPVNPYESFILMCMLSEEPLTVYNDVWELSYED